MNRSLAWMYFLTGIAASLVLVLFGYLWAVRSSPCNQSVLAVYQADGTWLLCAAGEVTHEQERTTEK